MAAPHERPDRGGGSEEASSDSPATPPRMPVHVAVIMDGNGRWARAHGLPRAAGHRAGAEAARRIVRAAGRAGVRVLTLYSFSTENWKRPTDEVDALMALCRDFLLREQDELRRENVRFRQIGRRAGLPPDVVRSIEEVERRTADATGLDLVVALNYGAREEIVDAVRALARRVQAGTLQPDAIDEATFAAALSTAGLPDPDLLIRSAGEMRVSNFLLWQISYAELYVSPALWPDFTPADFAGALRDFAARDRRFGAVTPGSV